MIISEAGLELISLWEGLRLTAYPDLLAGGILTIGFGHTGPDVQRGLMISRVRAFELLREDTSGAARQVGELVHRPLNQSQFDALVSLVFNAGSAPLLGTLGRLLNQGDFAGAAAEFGKWVKSRKNGQLVTVQGLVNRRAAEEAMFKGELTVHNPLAVLNRNETDWVSHYDALVGAGQAGSPEAKEFREKMRRQRKLIWRLAQPAAKGGDGNGWHFRHRVERYRLLQTRTT